MTESKALTGAAKALARVTSVVEGDSRSDAAADVGSLDAVHAEWKAMRSRCEGWIRLITAGAPYPHTEVDGDIARLDLMQRRLLAALKRVPVRKQ